MKNITEEKITAQNSRINQSNTTMVQPNVSWVSSATINDSMRYASSTTEISEAEKEKGCMMKVRGRISKPYYGDLLQIEYMFTADTTCVEENYYPYDKGEGVISISRMDNLFCKRIMSSFRKSMTSLISPYNCYSNAIIACEWLNAHGFPTVEVVDGYYRRNPKMLAASKMKSLIPNDADVFEWDTHRYLKKGDKYFDPTLEMISPEHIPNTEYRAERLFAPEVLTSFAVKLAQKQNISDTKGVKWCSSLDGLSYVGGTIPMPNGYINDNYELVDGQYDYLINHGIASCA